MECERDRGGHTNAGRRKKRPTRGGEGCSNVEKGCGGRERAERVNGGKEREVQKGRGRSCAGRVKERERERKDRRGELPATRSPSIYLAKTADTCLRRYTRVVL